MNISVDAENRNTIFASAFEHLPYGALVVTRSGNVLSINASLRAVLGLDSSAVVKLDDLFGGNLKRMLTDMRAAVSGGWLNLVPAAGDAEADRMGFDVRVIGKTGRRADLFLLIEMQTALVKDAFVNLSNELREANDSAARMRHEHRLLEATYRDLEGFSHTAAHDLKAPLRNIEALMGIIIEDHGDVLPDEAGDLLAMARKTSARLHALIGDLLAHAKSGMTALDLQSVQVASVIDDIREEYRAEMRLAQARIFVEGDLGDVSADPMLFRQMMSNIIGNALKYRDPDRAPVVTVSRIRTGEKADILRIADNGLGFDDVQRAQLFEAFKRLHNRADIEGSGVGLATCKTICRRHGWQLDGHGEPGVGAYFDIVLG